MYQIVKQKIESMLEIVKEQDMYHSLSIEGYKITDDLIEKVTKHGFEQLILKSELVKMASLIDVFEENKEPDRKVKTKNEIRSQVNQLSYFPAGYPEGKGKCRL